MSLLERFFRERRERRGLGGASHPSQPSYWLEDLFGGRAATSGVRVTRESALSWTPFAAGVRIIAETIGSLPCQLYERLEPRGRRLRRDHRLAPLLHDAPNAEMTALEFFELLQTHLPLFGFAAAQIVYDGQGRATELWPLNPDRVAIERTATGQRVYRVSLPRDEEGGVSGSALLGADEVLFVRGWGGPVGRSLVALHREAIGMGLATEIFGAAFFGRGATASSVLEHPGALSDEAQARLRKSIEDQVVGIDKSMRVLILEEGMKWHQLMVEPEKAQFLQLRKFQVTEAARMLRVPPHKLADLERATFSNIESQAIEFVQDTIRPWLVRWEQRLAMQLLSARERERLFVRFNVDALLRGDLESRYRAYLVGRQGGWLSANDVREREDLNPIPGGDRYVEQPAGTPAPGGTDGEETN